MATPAVTAESALSPTLHQRGAHVADPAPAAHAVAPSAPAVDALGVHSPAVDALGVHSPGVHAPGATVWLHLPPERCRALSG